MDDERLSAIESLGATVEVSAEGSSVRYLPETPQEGAVLYKILSILDPLPLVEVRQNRADLTDIFLQLVRTPL